MFCTECGTKLIDGAKFCTECGAPVKIIKTAEKISADIKDPAEDLQTINDEIIVSADEAVNETAAEAVNGVADVTADETANIAADEPADEPENQDAGTVNFILADSPEAPEEKTEGSEPSPLPENAEEKVQEAGSTESAEVVVQEPVSSESPEAATAEPSADAGNGTEKPFSNVRINEATEAGPGSRTETADLGANNPSGEESVKRGRKTLQIAAMSLASVSLLCMCLSYDRSILVSRIIAVIAACFLVFLSARKTPYPSASHAVPACILAVLNVVMLVRSLLLSIFSNFYTYSEGILPHVYRLLLAALTVLLFVHSAKSNRRSRSLNGFIITLTVLLALYHGYYFAVTLTAGRVILMYHLAGFLFFAAYFAIETGADRRGTKPEVIHTSIHVGSSGSDNEPAAAKADAPQVPETETVSEAQEQTDKVPAEETVPETQAHAEETVPETQAPAEDTETKDSKRFVLRCSRCGAVLPADSAFCNKCGYPVGKL